MAEIRRGGVFRGACGWRRDGAELGRRDYRDLMKRNGVVSFYIRVYNSIGTPSGRLPAKEASMTKTHTTHSKPRRFAKLIAALTLVTALSGCVVYPVGYGGGGYHHGGYYHWR